MSDVVAGALIAGIFSLLVAAVGIGFSAWVRRAQRKAEENERRLRALEDGNEHLMTNLRLDYDRALARAVAAEQREAEWRHRALVAERRVDLHLQQKENRKP